MPAPYEYLFIDQRGVNFYYDQIHPSPLYDKVPEWSAGIGLTGPRADASQKLSARPANLYERLEEVCVYLQRRQYLVRSFSHDDIVNGIADDGEIQYVNFVLTSLPLTKAVLPVAPIRGDQAVAQLILWLYSNHDTTHDTYRDLTSVCLIEDFTDPDAKVLHPGVSSFSALAAAIRSKLAGQEPANGAVDIVPQDVTSAIGGARERSIMLADPTESVIEWGGKIITARRPVEVLCRLRQYWSSSAVGTHVFGYPIFIRAGM